jgi:hypothetical protein
MADEHGSRETQRVNYFQNIVAQAIKRVLRRRIIGSTEPAPGDAIYMVIGRKLWRKPVEYVRGIPTAREEDERSARTAPIKHLKSDVFFNRYKANGVRGWVTPSSAQVLFCVERVE